MREANAQSHLPYSTIANKRGVSLFPDITDSGFTSLSVKLKFVYRLATQALHLFTIFKVERLKKLAQEFFKIRLENPLNPMLKTQTNIWWKKGKKKEEWRGILPVVAFHTQKTKLRNRKYKE